MRVTSCGAHLRGSAAGQHSSEETSQRWRAVDKTADLTGPGIEPQTSRTDNVRLATELTGRLPTVHFPLQKIPYSLYSLLPCCCILEPCKNQPFIFLKLSQGNAIIHKW